MSTARTAGLFSLALVYGLIRTSPPDRVQLSDRYISTHKASWLLFDIHTLWREDWDECRPETRVHVKRVEYVTKRR
jgi:hypothetical protein